MGLGPYPKVSLKDARNKRDKLKHISQRLLPMLLIKQSGKQLKNIVKIVDGSSC